MMDKVFDEFTEYLTNQRNLANNSLEAYKRDIRGFSKFLEEKGIKNFIEADNAMVVSYILFLKSEDRSSSTINRKIAAIRSLYGFLMEKGLIGMNPAAHIKSTKVEKKPLEYLSIEEVELLLKEPDESTKGIRDRGILELLYATGMRVSEIIEMDQNDVNIKMGFVACNGEHGKARIIPLGKPARAALDNYINVGRKNLIKGSDTPALFVNYSGERLTRQGLWKIIKYYTQKTGIQKKITPQILRHSFAVHMIQNGADLKSIQELLGHEDVSATQVYLVATKNRIKEVYDKSHPRAL